LNTYNPLLLEYAKELEKAIPEIDNWRTSPMVKKALEESDLVRAVEHHLKRLLWQPLHLCIYYLATLTHLIHLMPLQPILLNLGKEVLFYFNFYFKFFFFFEKKNFLFFFLVW